MKYQHIRFFKRHSAWVAIVLYLMTMDLAYAGRASDLFSEGLFSVSWGASLDDVREKYPGGNEKEYSGILSYSVHDSRTILAIPRTEKETIDFAFNSTGGLSSVEITFPPGEKSYLRLFNRCTEEFGPVKPDDFETMELLFGVYAGYSWPNDNGIVVRVGSESVGFKSFKRVLLRVYAPELSRPKEDKEALGF